MKSGDRESILSLLNRWGLLERVVGGVDAKRRDQYANKLILDSDRLLREPDSDEEFVTLRSLAERSFAGVRGWVHGLRDDVVGPARDW